jgi:hypothetical protein
LVPPPQDEAVLKRISNRFVRPEHLAMLALHCDPDQDHFPVIEFYCGVKPLVLTGPFRSLSFWLRMPERRDAGAMLFHTNAFSIHADGAGTVVRSDREMAEVPADTAHWVHVYVSQADGVFSREGWPQ